ncbi:hypothetical protein [Streptomyces sp. NPDC058108]|uniref:hypothetical protein n=1 Tax=Streptomyces sp. NPDC058108 TaxID=3346344 RepID=UPI0036EA1DFA
MIAVEGEAADDRAGRPMRKGRNGNPKADFDGQRVTCPFFEEIHELERRPMSFSPSVGVHSPAISFPGILAQKVRPGIRDNGPM